MADICCLVGVEKDLWAIRFDKAKKNVIRSHQRHENVSTTEQLLEKLPFIFNSAFQQLAIADFENPFTSTFFLCDVQLQTSPVTWMRVLVRGLDDSSLKLREFKVKDNKWFHNKETCAAFFSCKIFSAKFIQVYLKWEKRFKVSARKFHAKWVFRWNRNFFW